MNLSNVTAAVLCAAMAGSLAVAPASAHSDHRPRIGASHLTPSGAPEDWGTYCVTELAPLFREAIALNATMLASAAPTATDAAAVAPPASGNLDAVGTSPVKPYAPPADDATPSIPLLAPIPPSLMDAPEAQTDGITVFTARRIVTMDPGWPEGTAVAVKDGRILSVGTLDDLQPWLKRFPYKMDETFKDKVIYPGFVEAHGHPVMGSIAISRPPLSFFPLRNPYGDDFPGVKTRDDAFAALKKYVAAATSPTETIMTSRIRRMTQ